MARKPANPQPTPEKLPVADEAAAAPVPEAVPASPAEGGDLAAPVPDGAGQEMARVDGGLEVPAAPDASVPDVTEPQPGAPAPDAETSPPAPEGQGAPPTWAELNEMADMLMRFGQRLLQLESRVAKIAVVLQQNYGVRL
jgi:hypothetical protein